MMNCSDFATTDLGPARAYMEFLLQLRKGVGEGRLEGVGEAGYPHHFLDHLAEKETKIFTIYIKLKALDQNSR